MQSKSAIVVHLSSVHPRHDTRIFHKMCRSGVANGFQVALIVADGMGDAEESGISIHDVGKSKGRIVRMWHATEGVYRAALSLNADLYHLHDPELMPIGLKLKRHGKRVLFDAHEDLPKQILGKHYLSPPVRRILAGVFSRYEAYTCKGFDGVIGATPFIRDKFRSINSSTVDVCNFPLLSELQGEARALEKERRVCYVGGLTRSRGITELVMAMGSCGKDVRLDLAGYFEPAAYESELRLLEGWRYVDTHGHVGRKEVRGIMGKSIAGLVTLHPLVNYRDALPVKMFEYMSAGIPVIASDFPLWREIIAGNKCGSLVDPLKPEQIASAIHELILNPERAELMGQNGREAVEERYNWGIEEQKLLAFYNGILGRKLK